MACRWGVQVYLGNITFIDYDKIFENNFYLHDLLNRVRFNILIDIDSAYLSPLGWRLAKPKLILVVHLDFK